MSAQTTAPARTALGTDAAPRRGLLTAAATTAGVATVANLAVTR